MDWLFTFADPTIDWNYAMVTLVVRFIGVFFVMFAMQVALQVSSRVVQRIETRAEAGAASAAAPPPMKAGEPAAPTPAMESSEGIDAATAAAIGLALSLESRSAAPTTDAGPSSWAVAGRLAQLNRLPR